MNDINGVAPAIQRENAASIGAADRIAHQPPAAPFTPTTNLNALIRSRVLPELAEKHRIDTRYVYSRAVELAGLLLSDAVEPIERLLEEAVAQESATRQFRIALLELTARLLGNMWLADACSETDVVVALCLLQSAVRRASRVRPIRSTGSSRGRVLVAPLPGERHFLGVIIASDMLHEAGWGVTVRFPADVNSLIAQLRSERFDMLHLALSDVLQCKACVPVLRRAVKMARSASLNRSLKITVGGRLFAESKLHPTSVGAEVIFTANC